MGKEFPWQVLYPGKHGGSFLSTGCLHATRPEAGAIGCLTRHQNFGHFTAFKLALFLSSDLMNDTDNSIPPLP